MKKKKIRYISTYSLIVFHLLKPWGVHSNPIPDIHAILQAGLEVEAKLYEVITYTPDSSRDFWKLPIMTLKEREGDCEDIAILFCFFMAHLGYSPSIEIIELPDLSRHAQVFYKGLRWLEAPKPYRTIGFVTFEQALYIAGASLPSKTTNPVLVENAMRLNTFSTIFLRE